MEKELAEIVVEQLENDGVDAHIYENYSGRRMYGKTTTGVVFSGNEIHFMNALISLIGDTDQEINITERIIGVDNLGYDTIIY